mgnify:CR=1 FL=1
MQDQRFLESEWDYCVVLDACRYDVFSEVYDEYLEGELQKRWSTGSSTPEWAYRTFTDHHDIAYFSGNPFINSLGIPLNELKWGASCEYEWSAADHISHVVDVWEHGWDDELGTIPPESMVESFRNHPELVADADRTVVHYMQPHAPFLSRGKGQKLTQIQKGIKRQGEREAMGADGGLLTAIGDAVRPRVERVLDGNKLAMKIGLWLETGLGGVLSDGTRETAMGYHEENLELALESVAELVAELDGDVVVTADHGEAFGEEGVWEHHIETHIPALMEVPWLEVEN